MEREPLISIRCLVYNHEPFLRQCLDGIVMQQTDYPYEAIVHDDASTDGSAPVIREYAEKYSGIGEDFCPGPISGLLLAQCLRLLG